MNMAQRHVVILAGGQGTRLASRMGNLPKPMVPLLGRPLLEHQVQLCVAHGFKSVTLLVHFRHEVIREHFGDGSRWGAAVGYALEAVPRGTAGALRDALPMLPERFLVLYGDTYLDVDLTALWERHAETGAVATLFVHPNDHPQDSDLIDCDHSGRVLAVHGYPRPPTPEYRNRVNAALYVMQADAVARYTRLDGKPDIAKHLFPTMLKAGEFLHAHLTPEYIKDMGTPERLDKVTRDIDAGLPERLSSRSLRTAVFLDRDGTLNQEVGHLKSPDQLQLIEGAAGAVRRLNRDGRLAVLVTNQPVLARGDVTEQGLEQIHARLESLLGVGGAYLDGIYVCPHHPDAGFEGEVAHLKVVCNCRKPAPGLLDRACGELGIDRRTSWMVGDTTADIEAGRQAGVRTVLVRTGWRGRDDKRPLQPDYVVPDVAAAVDWIVQGHAHAGRALLPALMRCQHGPRLVLVAGQARAGKSMAAQVLRELLGSVGRTAHVVSLDAWLRPQDERPARGDLLSRYDLPAIEHDLVGTLAAEHRRNLRLPVYDRMARAMHQHALSTSLGPSDTLIVEGVPAMLVAGLMAWPGRICIFVSAPEPLRQQRLRNDYLWRGATTAEVDQLLAQRCGVDEAALVDAAAQLADIHIEMGAAP